MDRWHLQTSLIFFLENMVILWVTVVTNRHGLPGDTLGLPP